MKLFKGAEQGCGENKNNLLVFFAPSLKKLAHKWIKNEHGKPTKFNIFNGSTSVPKLKEEDEQYMANLR